MDKDDNKYNESLVKHILLSRFSDYYQYLTDNKQPAIDLYEPNLNVGVEITEANLGTGFNQFIQAGLDYTKNKLTDNAYKKLCDKNKKNMLTLYPSGGFIAKEVKNKTGEIYDDSCDSQDKLVFDLFVSSLCKKNKHFIGHYDIFSNVDLFIHDLYYFHHLTNIDLFIELALNFITSNQIYFRYVYFNMFTMDSANCVFQFDILNKTCEYISISNHEMTILGKYTYYEDLINKEDEKRISKN